ncbi:hypothetical protein PP175_03595 [Aneurinibacillus sp. Ricciae_BoGa-3]|uniref:hypothetical protein n=1 Tax=Aneurinibacillus sp. Ricciae_BoGa-3 TaxID=3022697 RepID=UPI002342760F|nr:hypothetical protein [Aneurinibacillus sp. Ricciae_BoGa-3]WCK55085.1 hypothetical protein PP175_03595 [Aneurinibacillus sp. Ricciae_BoGa-3]
MHQYPYYGYPYPVEYHSYPYLEQETLGVTAPVVHHGLKEAQKVSYSHALQEAVAISYLMGKGYNFLTAWQIVESWWKRGGFREQEES